VFSDSQYSVSPPRAPRLWIGLNQEEDFGPDPSDPAFTAKILIEICRKKKVPIKVLLTDQKVIGGLGNAYVDEILWVAKIKHDGIARSDDWRGRSTAKSATIFAFI
jgi:formamidopyrimidine-DNA glycosylase